MIDGKIDKFFRIFRETKNPAYDVETNGLKWQNCYCCGYSVSDGKDAAYIPVRHAMDRGGEGNITQVENFEKELAKVVDAHPGKIIGHNIKFDEHMGSNHGVKLGNKVKDTMTRAALLDENRFSYNLENCLKEFPDIPQKKGKQLYEHIARMVGCKPTRDAMGHYHRLSGEDPLAVEYAEFDTLGTHALYYKQEHNIYGENLDIVDDMESKLTYVLQKMERLGVRVDLEELEKCKKIVHELHIEAYSQVPLSETLEPINVRSGKDLQEYFKHCEITDWPYTDPTERHPEGQPSFKKEYLGKTEEGLVILNARKFDHFINSFLAPFDGFVHNERIHPNFNQSRSERGGAKPGRLSCYDPNLQQVPKRDKQLGKIYRKVFVPDHNYILFEFDHSQAEPRLYAHYSDEPTLIEGYNQTPAIDMHDIAAKYMQRDRDFAKNLNLALMYGIGAEELSNKLGVSYDQAKAIMKQWFRTFPNVSNFTRKAASVAEQRGYVRTILGRRARFPDPRWAYRAANRVIQGSSADILKWKMVEIDRWITKNGHDDVVHMLLNIHDSLLFQIHKDYLHLAATIKAMFESVQVPPFNLKVPFRADYHEGINWSEASYGKAA